MASQQDFPLITDSHAPTRHHPYTEPYTNGSSSSSDPNPTRSRSRSGSETSTPNNNNKKPKTTTIIVKDREEWSDTAIACLLEAYTHKYNQLLNNNNNNNKGNLRGRDWEEVAESVAEKCGGGCEAERERKSWKSVEQCKNKIDNLKKRYKVELQRIGNNNNDNINNNNNNNNNSNWHWFDKIEGIMGNIGKVGGECNLRPKQQQLQVNHLKWRRVVFKISGTALAGNGNGNCQSIDSKVAMQIAREVATACRVGVEVAIVIGGRNFFCGDTWVTATGLDRPTAYQIGMMATVMNSILLQSALEKLGVQTRVQSAFSLPEVAEPYSRQRAIRHLEKGRVVIFGGVGAGTGNPLFTTDTAAALRASEINADAVLKGTNVNGVYDCHSGNGNVTLDHISFREVVTRGVISMDMMAITYCEENGIPVVVFNLLEPGNISRALCGDQVGTLIDQAGRIS